MSPPGRRLASMISVRLSPEAAAKIRAAAEREGVSVSAFLRLRMAALDEKARRDLAWQHRNDIDIDSAEAVEPWRPVLAIGRVTDWHCEHLSISSPFLAGPPSMYCGCRMRPGPLTQAA